MEEAKHMKSDLDYIMILIMVMWWIMPIYEYLMRL